MRSRYFLLPLSLIILCSAAYRVTNYLSHLNSNRPRLPRVQFIILHTTEGGNRGSLDVLRQEGKAHYMITTKGEIIKIIEENRIANHAGFSQWDGVRSLNKSSIGIEVVGYHNKYPTRYQIEALRNLLGDLKRRYKVRDDRVLTHSMVSYSPSRSMTYLPKRGRKNGCGMSFAIPAVRRAIGLQTDINRDPDVADKTMRVGEVSLFNFLFTRRPVLMTERAPSYLVPAVSLASPKTVVAKAPKIRSLPKIKVAINDIPIPRSKPGYEDDDEEVAQNNTDVDEEVEEPDEDATPQELPENAITPIVINRDVSSAMAAAGWNFGKHTTLYILPKALPDGRVFSGAHLNTRKPKILTNLPFGTEVLVGYKYGGVIQSKNKGKIAKQVGEFWNAPDTFYLLPEGVIISGDQANDVTVGKGSVYFFQEE